LRLVLRRILLVLLAIFIPLLLGECVVRLMGLSPELRRIRMGQQSSLFRFSDNPVLGYELRENAKDGNSYHSEDSKTNSHGQWDREREYEKPVGRKRILVLGDSVVFGDDVFDFKNTMTRVLERILADQNIEVLNFGVTGYCTRAEVELLKVKGLRYDPDLVILLFVWNDYDSSRNDLGRTVEATQPEYAKWLFVRSALFRLLCLQFDLFDFREGAKKQKAYSKAIGPDNVRSGLALLKELSEQQGFKTFVAVWPYFSPNGIADFESRDIDDREDYIVVSPSQPLAIEELAREQGISTFRLSSFFLENSDIDPLKTSSHFTVDGMHATKEGCEMGAKALKSILDEHPEYLDDEGS
jgi:hypothetical protein